MTQQKGLCKSITGKSLEIGIRGSVTVSHTLMTQQKGLCKSRR